MNYVKKLNDCLVKVLDNYNFLCQVGNEFEVGIEFPYNL